MSLTKKQKVLLDFITEFVQTSGYSPTLREIMQALGYKSVATVAKHVDNLVALGYVRKREGEARSLEVVSADAEAPWWAELEREAQRRELSEHPERREEATILRRAVAILRASSE